MRAKVLEGVLSAAGQPMSAEQYAQAVEAGAIPQEMQQKIEGAVSAQLATSEIQAQISAETEKQKNALIEQNMKSDEVTSQINAAVSQAAAGQGSLKQRKDQLESYQQFYDGLKAYTAGVGDAFDGSRELSIGAKSLYAGAQNLLAGTKTLSAGGAKLYSGSKELYAVSYTHLDVYKRQRQDC